MNILNARNDNKGILITCPHCKLGSRYDGSYIEDAIKIRHDIVCVACGEVFNLVVSIPVQEAAKNIHALPCPALFKDKNGELHDCPACGAKARRNKNKLT